MVQDVVATNFVTQSHASKEVFKTATLLRTLNVNSLIIGENGVGKKTLAQYILPNAAVVDASIFDDMLAALESASQIIITNLHNSPNIQRVLDTIKVKNAKVVATASYHFQNLELDEIFSVQFDIPPLAQREEDVQELIKLFSQHALSVFGISKKDYEFTLVPDLSENSISLQRQVMIFCLLKNVKGSELMDIIEHYLYEKLGSNNDYRNFLHLYEAPLIKAGLKKFKSQLQLADILGLNRNTLRKKIAENKEFLESSHFKDL